MTRQGLSGDRCTAAASSPARADNVPAAQALFDQAKKAMAAHNYAEACPKLEESLRMQEAVGTLLNLADCYEQNMQLASAWAKFHEVAARAHRAGRADVEQMANDRVRQIQERLSFLTIVIPRDTVV